MGNLKFSSLQSIPDEKHANKTANMLVPDAESRIRVVNHRCAPFGTAAITPEWIQHPWASTWILEQTHFPGDSCQNAIAADPLEIKRAFQESGSSSRPQTQIRRDQHHGGIQRIGDGIASIFVTWEFGIV